MFPAYFVTLDPYVVDLAPTDWGGVVIKSTGHSHKHKQAALLGQDRMKTLNTAVTGGNIGGNGITKEYIQEMLGDFKLTENPTLLTSADAVYEGIKGRGSLQQYKSKLQTTESIINEDKAIWLRYKSGYVT